MASLASWIQSVSKKWPLPHLISIAEFSACISAIPQTPWGTGSHRQSASQEELVGPDFNYSICVEPCLFSLPSDQTGRWIY